MLRLLEENDIRGVTGEERCGTEINDGACVKVDARGNTTDDIIAPFKLVPAFWLFGTTLLELVPSPPPPPPRPPPPPPKEGISTFEARAATALVGPAAVTTAACCPGVICVLNAYIFSINVPLVKGSWFLK
jgi:hypothetical protein